jgi:hypothetical protein
MRLIAEVQNGHSVVKRLMIYEDKDGCYVFHYATAEDGPCFADAWFESLHEAKSACAEQYGVSEAAWSLVADPMPYCQHDIIAPCLIALD